MLSNKSSNTYRTAITQYLLTVLFFATLVITLSIFSYHPNDISTFSKTIGLANTQSTHNIFGSIGANFADWCIELFGFSAHIISLFAIIWILISFRKKTPLSLWLLRFLGLPHIIIGCAALLSTVHNTLTFQQTELLSGGILGTIVSQWVQHYAGHIGATLIFLFTIIASLPLSLGISPVAMLAELLTKAPFIRARQIAANLTPLSSDEKNSNPISIQNMINEPKKQYINNNSILETPITAHPTTHNKAIQKADSYGESEKISSEVFTSLANLLLNHKISYDNTGEKEALQIQAKQLEEKLSTFGITGHVAHSQPGPVVNVHEFEPAAGIKVSRVMSLQDDLALGLRAQSVLMAPQPGKSTIGIEIPALTRHIVSLKEILTSPEFINSNAQLPMGLGKLVDGKPLIVDLSAMPHLLVAGATGSGKSVGINAMILSLLMHNTPKQVRLILIDPKMLELSTYDGIGHLLMPVLTDSNKAAAALRWVIDEMERRYKIMKNKQVRSISSYNQSISNDINAEHLPFIVVVIDELCDLMMTAPRDVEASVQRIAQKSRAAGIHLILATQRPSVDVLTGVIKANLPCRIAFQVASKHDSRTIIETMGAEKLLGKGDMLFLPPGTSRLIRSHCAFVNDHEISSIAAELCKLFPTAYDSCVIDKIEKVSTELSSLGTDNPSEKFDIDEAGNSEIDENRLYEQAVTFAQENGMVSTSSIQRQFRIGYNKAARIMDKMEKNGLVGAPEAAGKPRQVLGGRACGI